MTRRAEVGSDVSDELDRLAHHIGKACSKTRVFKRPNRSFERCEVFWCHAINASKCWRSAIPPTSTTGAVRRHYERRWRRLSSAQPKRPAAYLW